MTREEAIDTVRRCCPHISDSECYFETAMRVLVPELAESEDERIRKFLIWIVENVFDNIMGLSLSEEKIKDLIYKFNGIQTSDILSWLEKQKEADKSMEAVDRIDKYINEHVANAHDMKDSNPDKKYYRGWDDALSEMAGILQDVYSNEKQKEQKHYWKPTETDVALFNKAVTTNKALTPTERAQLDIIRSKFCCCGAVNCCGIVQKEQKPISWTELTWKDIVELEGIINNVHYDFSAGIGQESFGKEVLERFRSTKGVEYLDEAEQKYWREEEQKPAEWSETDNVMIGNILLCLKENCLTDEMEWLKSLRPQAKQEWSEEDEKVYSRLLKHYEDLTHCITTADRHQEIREELNFLKSIRPSWKPSEEQIYSLGTVVKGAGEYSVGSVGYNLSELYKQLKKLMKE